MYDPFDELEKVKTTYTTQDQLATEEAIQQLQGAELLQQAAAEQAAGTEVSDGVSPPVTTPAPRFADEEPAPEPKSKKKKKEETPLETIYQDGSLMGAMVRDPRSVLEGLLAVPSGVVDFGVDLLNLLPRKDNPAIPNPFGGEVPRIPKFQNELAQSVREISSVVAPTLYLTSKGQLAGAAANARVGWGIGKSQLVKWLGTAGVGAGAGAFVDATNTLNESDDNLQGSLKKMFPKTFSWISNDWATLDSDSPDVKRAKNVNEGVGLGILSDLLVGAGKLIRGISKTQAATRYIPESENAKSWFERAKDMVTGDTSDDVVEASMRSREDILDELGEYGLSKEVDLNKPLLGVHEAFGLEESGIRSVDPMGAVGAAVDAARIDRNVDTVYGRLGSIISEAALKYGVEATELPRRAIIKGIAEEIKSAGKFSVELPSGKKITAEEIDQSGTRLAEIMLDPRMDTGMLKGTMDEYKELVSGYEKLDAVGYNAALKSIKGYLDEFMNMDTLKAQAYLTTSLAGQVSDIAEGARYMEGTAAIERAQEQILDRLEYLLVEKGLANYTKDSSFSFIKTLKRLEKDPMAVAGMGQNIEAQSNEVLSQILTRAKNTTNSLREISQERPEFLKPLQVAWEFSDGNTDTMAKLNNFVEQSLPNIQKAFFDDQPEIPNVLVQGMWANIYNSILTTVSTPLKAGVGNAVLLMEKPVAVLGGALMSGDLKAVRRGWYQYSGFIDSMQKGLKHMSQVFHKASIDPTSVNYIMRDDLVKKNEQTMSILHSYAEAAQKSGNDGPMALYLQGEALHDLSMNPLLRFGANAMSALDGFSRAVLANAEARGRVYDKFIDGDVPLNNKTLKEANDEIYNSMFDRTGMITDKAVNYASAEVAMNLDSPGVEALSNVIQKFPVLRPFMMFPKTTMNVIDMANKHSPWALFAKEYNDIAFKPLDQFAEGEIESILTAKGLPATPDAFFNLRYEMRGRKAIGTIALTSAFGMLVGGNLRGNGHYDKERQQTRTQLGWKPKTYRGTDGKWYSYEWLGPAGDFLALAADVFDNFDSITENDAASMWGKLMFIMGSSITNRSTLAGLEPMNDVLSGNPSAANRWAASFASSLAPLSGFRNELGRLMYPQLRELDQNFMELLRNRNKFLDGIDPNNALPDAHDWIDGRKVGYPENIFVRMVNAVTPFKIADEMSKERQFLIDIEYDNRPSFRTNGKGVEYTPAERSELYSIMGRQGIFKEAIEAAMKTTTAKQWRNRIKKARGKGAEIDPTEWENLYNDLDVAMVRAVRAAQLELTNRDDVLRRQYEQDVNTVTQQFGIPTVPILENK
jgi:hypothetical protein